MKNLRILNASVVVQLTHLPNTSKKPYRLRQIVRQRRTGVTKNAYSATVERLKGKRSLGHDKI
jgi:hypothetical protein